MKMLLDALQNIASNALTVPEHAQGVRGKVSLQNMQIGYHSLISYAESDSNSSRP